MAQEIHAFSKEEIMAYLDGELTTERRAAAAEHLEKCDECQGVASEFCGISERMAGWQIESSTAVAPDVAAGSSKTMFWRNPWLLGAAAAVVVLSVGLSTRLSHVKQARTLTDSNVTLESERSSAPTYRTKADSPTVAHADIAIPAAPKPLASAAAEPSALPRGGSAGGGGRKELAPLIVRTAQLNITSKNFENIRSEVERITKLHEGYIGQLQLNTTVGESKSLTASLHIPGNELDAAIADLKHLGHVNSESQSGEDVTQRYVDLEARLTNLRTTEQRLQQILKDRTGKLSDVLEVEQAVDNTRGEIDEAVAEQKTLTNQISFATIQLTISEEYRAALEVGTPSVGTRLRNAIVLGYSNAVEDAISILVFVLSITPTLVILAVVGFLPALWIWRKRSYLLRRI